MPTLVVVGASAGGVEALVRFVAGLPPDLPAAVLVTVHVGERSSALPRVLDRAGPLPAEPAAHGAPLRPGRIVVAPPDRHLLVAAGRQALSAGPKVNRHRPAVDVMFTAAARAAGHRVVAVVLSGVLDDGAVGSALVRRAGGQVLVQAPGDALFDAMPAAALAAAPEACAAPVAALGPLVAARTQALDADGGDLVVDNPPADATGEAAPLAGRDAARLDAPQLACPECGGGLARIDLPRIGYFRCHVGHQFGPRSLEAAQREAAESKLWAAVAALQEHAAVARHLGSGVDDAAEPAFRRAAEHSEDLARVLQGRLTTAHGTDG